MSAKLKVYFHEWIHWDLDKVMRAFASHYGVPYESGDYASTEAVVMLAYKEYYGVHDLNKDTHMQCIKDQVQDMLRDIDALAPACVRFLALHYVKKKMQGFDLYDLHGPPPYPDNWEKPRPKFEGEIALTHYAF